MEMCLPLEVIVNRVCPEAEDILSFELVNANTTPLTRFTAGAHIDVQVPGGPVRQYSLCNSEQEAHRYVIAVLKDPSSRGGSRGMHELTSGARLRISDPKNHFPLVEQAEQSLLLAGGIGITPILCMAERLLATNASFALHYCTRSKQRTAFRTRIEGSPLVERTTFYFDDDADRRRPDIARLLGDAAPSTHLYVCGPRAFMEAVLSSARALGWAEDRIHTEFFAGSVDPSDAGEAFVLKLHKSNMTVNVDNGQTAVHALAAAGVSVPTSCEQGVCGTCLTRVLEGVPDHRDSYLTMDEREANDQFLPCCSRARTPMLVLDL